MLVLRMLNLSLFAFLGPLFIWSGPVAISPSRPGPVGSPEACNEITGQIITTSVSSTVYGTSVPASVYLPPCFDRGTWKLPVIYLLHGGNADETQWPDLRVQREADMLIAQGAPPFMVVMPGGVYRDSLDYAAFVLNDLLPGIEQQFNVKATASGRAIGGLSLGGYWALQIAFQHPNLFAAVGGHSPVVSRGDAEDPLALARTASGLSRLRIMLDVGDLDSLREGTRLLADRLNERDLTVTFAVNPGAHNRPYWRSYTADYLRFYLGALTASPCRRSPLVKNSSQRQRASHSLHRRFMSLR